MRFVTRIVKPKSNNGETIKLRTIDGILLPATHNQIIKINSENIVGIVKSIEDSIYEDIIYRYVEVVVLDNKFID